MSTSRKFTWEQGMPKIVVILLMLAMVMLDPSAIRASEDAARSFGACVLRGGDVRRDDDDIACRHITSYTMRTYLSGETTCGEEVQYEIWDEIRSGTVTYAFASHRTVDLPEVGETWPEASSTPVPCVDNSD